MGEDNTKALSNVIRIDDERIPLLRILTDRGTEYCGNPERHEYELYL